MFHSNRAYVYRPPPELIRAIHLLTIGTRARPARATS
jgi:hypothetical protein